MTGLVWLCKRETLRVSKLWTQTVLAPVVSSEELRRMILAVRQVHLAAALKSYLVDIAEASRHHPATRISSCPMNHVFGFSRAFTRRARSVVEPSR